LSGRSLSQHVYRNRFVLVEKFTIPSFQSPLALKLILRPFSGTVDGHAVLYNAQQSEEGRGNTGEVSQVMLDLRMNEISRYIEEAENSWSSLDEEFCINMSTRAIDAIEECYSMAKASKDTEQRNNFISLLDSFKSKALQMRGMAHFQQVTRGAQFNESSAEKKNRAERDLKNAIECDPDNAEALFSYGFMRLQDGLPNEAIDYFNKSLSAKPSEPVVYMNRAMAYDARTDRYTREDVNRIVKDCTAALDLGLNHPRTHLLRAKHIFHNYTHLKGAIHGDLFTLEQAINDLTKAIQMGETGVFVFYLRALCYNASQQPELAMKDLQHIKKTDPAFFSRMMPDQASSTN